jgi:hypothetical protein
MGRTKFCRTSDYDHTSRTRIIVDTLTKQRRSAFQPEEIDVPAFIRLSGVRDIKFANAEFSAGNEKMPAPAVLS